jgi:GTPase
MFVDRVRILARAGNGGRGGLSFLRQKNMPDGGPDGGNGGKGGDVVVVVNPHLNNLIRLKYSPHQYAKNGQSGGQKQMSGKAGQECVIEVPPGTVISRLPNPDFEPIQPGDLQSMPQDLSQLELIADMVHPGQRHILCKGGNGGRGNMNFKSSTNQAPRRYEEGREGEHGQFQLELKSIADVGLVGYPNAGKSTLLTRLSKAQPKIAPYPFTTLQPHVGVIENDDFERIVMADIPGLIEGAHEGIGLGHEFLRHIERCRLLLFVIDMSGNEGRDPRDDFAQLRKEIRLYQAELAQRSFLVVANKMDLPTSAENLKAFKRKVRYPVIPISAESRDGLDALLKKLREMLPAA